MWARYEEQSIYKDKILHAFVNELNYDFTEIKNHIDLMKQLTIVICHNNFELLINNFIKRFPNATIVDLGAGFNTLFYKTDNNTLKWYDIDLPEVINIKKKLLPPNPRYKFIAKSVLDYSWMGDITENRGGVFIIAGSLFKYLKESDIKDLFAKISKKFPGSELAFDCENKTLLEISRQSFQKEGLDPSLIKFSLENSNILKSLIHNITILEQYSIFSRTRREKFWPKEVRDRMDDIDHSRINSIYHIRLN
ncbi:MAG: class I SAM-dependent methyltransferase [Promethearchaeota archaeon]